MGREIEFHIGLTDTVDYAARLLRKAWRGRWRAVATGDAARLTRLDALLWTAEPGDFVPHLRLRRAQAWPALLARTPLWLADEPQAVRAGWQAESGAGAAGPAGGWCGTVLVNLGPEMPGPLDGYDRIVELVAEDPQELQPGRERWKQYRSAGHLPRDLRGAASA